MVLNDKSISDQSAISKLYKSSIVNYFMFSFHKDNISRGIFKIELTFNVLNV